MQEVESKFLANMAIIQIACIRFNMIVQLNITYKPVAAVGSSDCILFLVAYTCKRLFFFFFKKVTFHIALLTL